MPQVPGLAILIADARAGRPQPIDVTPLRGTASKVTTNNEAIGPEATHNAQAIWAAYLSRVFGFAFAG
jgi:hypothetical protein